MADSKDMIHQTDRERERERGGGRLRKRGTLALIGLEFPKIPPETVIFQTPGIQ